MNKKFFLFLMLFGMYSNSTHAISPNTPKVLGISTLVFGSLLSSLGQKPEDLPVRFFMVAFGSALVYYVSGRYTPHNKFISAFKITKKIEADTLFKCRKESNATLYEILNIHEDYSFLRAVKTLHNLFIDLEMAHRNVLSAPEDLPEDAVFEEKCNQLASHIQYLQHEIKIYTKRIMHTTQWYNEINNDDGPYSEPVLSYLDSVKWSTNLISHEVSLKVHTYYTADEQITNTRLSFRETFFRLLVDLTA